MREVHGDLRAEHVLLDETVQVVDCIEFDRALRELDVADDLASLVMDLATYAAERFARVLIRAYRDAGGDPGEDRLIAFYAGYRALVRAKVALLRAAQFPASSSEHVSDASLSVVVRESSAWEPLDELPPEAHVTLRSDRPESVSAVGSRLHCRWP